MSQTADSADQLQLHFGFAPAQDPELARLDTLIAESDEEADRLRRDITLNKFEDTVECLEQVRSGIDHALSLLLDADSDDDYVGCLLEGIADDANPKDSRERALVEKADQIVESSAGKRTKAVSTLGKSLSDVDVILQNVKKYFPPE